MTNYLVKQYHISFINCYRSSALTSEASYHFKGFLAIFYDVDEARVTSLLGQGRTTRSPLKQQSEM